MSATDPHFTDGRSAILDPIVEVLNLTGDGTTYQRYDYLSDNLDWEAMRKVFQDADGSHLGSDTRTGPLSGSISLQKNLASYKFPKPGHIVHLARGNDDFYLISGKAGRSFTRNEISKGSFDVLQAINPIIASLLTELYGGRYLLAQAHATAIPAALTAAQVLVNTRAGSTIAYSLAASPGSTVPSYLAIDGTTGAMTFTAPTAGTYEVDVVVTETLANQPTRTGFVHLSIILS